MIRHTSFATAFSLKAILLLTLLAVATTETSATERSFGIGSYILAADSCWQPNNDATNTISGLPSYCDPNKNDQSLFQVFGVLYALLDTGDQPDQCANNDGSVPQQKALFGYCKQIKVYWIIDNNKASTQDPDLTLTDATVTASTPIVTIFNSTKTGTVAPMSTYVNKADSGAAQSISYRGGPFVIDGNDLTAAELNTIKTKFPTVKIHKANISFSGNVDKILIGKPPKVAVLNEGASDVLEDYIRSAGLFPWRNTVFQYVGARDILAGCLENPVAATCTTKRPDISTPFQLLWAPHWIVADKWDDGSTPTAAEQKAVIGKIRSFLEAGNSGFFECASIESIEGSATGGLNVGTAGGFTLGSANATPRLDTNGGCSDVGKCSAGYLKYEQIPFWLIQCGGWNYQATGGHVHNMRPRMTSSYRYLTTQTADDSSTTMDDRYFGTQLTRFIHDDSAKVGTAYASGTGSAAGYYLYDYLVGGRINGSPSQGYLSYLPGHKYIGCTNSTVYDYPPSRTFDLLFDGDPAAGSTIAIELVHTGCTQGSSCPKVQYDLASGIGTRSTTGGKVDLNAEFAVYDTGGHRLSGLLFTSSDPNATASLQINDFYVTFNNNGGAVRLINIADLTETDKRRSLCAPNSSSSPVRCSPSAPVSQLTLTFSKDISTSSPPLVLVKLPFSGGSVEASYNVATKQGSLVTSGNLTLDMGSAIYDGATHTLSNIRVMRGATCADVTLTDIQVYFSGDATLDLVYNDTTSQAVCAPNQNSPANCSSAPVPAYSISTYLSWAAPGLAAPATTPPTDVALTLNYTCTPACTTSSITASRGAVATNTDMTFDFKNISVDIVNRKISNIQLTILDADKTVKLTSYTLTYTGSFSDNRAHDIIFWDTTNSKQIFKATSVTAPGTWNPGDYTIAKQTVTSSSTWSYLVGAGICSYYISPYLSACTIDWTKSNTCGIKYVLNTLLALRYTLSGGTLSTTQPLATSYLAQDSRTVLYKASYDYPSYRGHLKMIKPPTATQDKVDGWDAASAVPHAGDGTVSFPTAPISSTDTTSPRYIFTNLPDTTSHITFDPNSVATLKSLLDSTGTDDDVKALINTVRGRRGCSATSIYGTTEDSKRLWAIETSTPALKTYSKYVESTAAAAINEGKDRRDRILFAGADDGMLHAFWAGSYDKNAHGYLNNTTGNGTGKEIWAYIPSALLPYLNNPPLTSDSINESDFEPKVAVDGSPALGDFLVCTAKNGTACTNWEWKTRLVATATIRGQNRGIVFALDVTDPYQPQLLWEFTYDKTDDAGCSGTSRNCNMGYSRGVAIGTAQIGNQLKDYAFLTSSWIKRKIVKNADGSDVYDPVTTCEASNTSALCGYGVSAFALELDTGKVVWERSLPYTRDAVNINEKPAVPALMDRDNNGSYDYVVFGDMQGRLWALRFTDGKNLADSYTADNHVSNPVYQVSQLDGTGLDSDPAVPTGAAEPIGAPVAVYRDLVVLATGGANVASDGSTVNRIRYRVEVIRIKIDGVKKYEKIDEYTMLLDPYDSGTKKGAEKVWAKPAITSDLWVYVATARNYFSNMAVSDSESDGRVIVMHLNDKRSSDVNGTNAISAASGSNVFVVGGKDSWHAGGFVGGFDFDRKHAYVVTLMPDHGKSVLQIGSEDFSSAVSKTNPFKVLWWRKF